GEATLVLCKLHARFSFLLLRLTQSDRTPHVAGSFVLADESPLLGGELSAALFDHQLLLNLFDLGSALLGPQGVLTCIDAGDDVLFLQPHDESELVRTIDLSPLDLGLKGHFASWNDRSLRSDGGLLPCGSDLRGAHDDARFVLGFLFGWRPTGDQ